MFPMLEMAAGRFRHIEQVGLPPGSHPIAHPISPHATASLHLCHRQRPRLLQVLLVYNMASALNDFRVDEERQIAMERWIRSMRPYPPANA